MSEPPGEQLWFGGLPVTGTRVLGDEEVAELRERVREIRRDSWTGAAVLAGTAAAAAAVMYFATSLPLVAVLGLGVIRAMQSLLSTVRFTAPRRVAALRRDVADCVVSICSSGDHMIEVLPHSAMVWRDNGAAPNKPVFYVRATTAPPPPHAAAAANFVREIRDSLFAHQRSLTADERSELAQYAPRPSVASVALPVVCVAGIALTLWRVLAGATDDLFTPFAFGVVAFRTGRETWKRLKQWRLFAPDVEAGVVLIIRLQQEGELTPADEYLARSGYLWTRGGIPALWRRTRRVA